MKLSVINPNKREWQIGKTKVIKETLDPTWNEHLKLAFDAREVKELVKCKSLTLVLAIFDEDFTFHDPLGEVRLDLSTERNTQLLEKWHKVAEGQSGERKAEGELLCAVSMVLRRAIWLNAGDAPMLEAGPPCPGQASHAACPALSEPPGGPGWASTLGLRARALSVEPTGPVFPT